MGMVRFKLDSITAFRNNGKNGAGQHYCVNCARKSVKEETLIPFLEGQLTSTLCDFGKDMAAMISCDECGLVMETYYPENFWNRKSVV